MSHIGMGLPVGADGRLQLLLFRPDHPRQHMLEWCSRDPEIAAEWVAKSDNQDQHQGAGGS